MQPSQVSEERAAVEARCSLKLETDVVEQSFEDDCGATDESLIGSTRAGLVVTGAREEHRSTV